MLIRIPAMAQLNESDTTRFQLRAGTTGAWQKGNVDLLVLRGRLEFVTSSHNALVFKTLNNSLYQEFSGFKADNDINSRNYLYLNPYRKIYPFAMVYFQTNYRRAIDFRSFGGVGATWQIVQQPITTLKLSASLIYELTRFRGNQFNEVAYNGNETIELARATIYLAGWHKLVENRLRVYYSGYWQPGLNGTSNNRFQLDAGLDFPLWKGLNATLQYAYSFEQIVTASVKQNDQVLTYGLSYSIKN